MEIYKKNRIHRSLKHWKNFYVYLSSIGFDKCESSYSYTSYGDMHLIHYIKSGKGTFTINGNTYTLSEGDAFYIPPNTTGIYSADIDNPWEYYYFSFNGALASDLLKKTIFFNDNYVSKISNHKIADIIYNATLTIYEKPSIEFFGTEKLFQLLQFFLISSMPETSKTTSPVLVENAKKIIQQNLQNTVKISQIAKQLNVHRSYLYKIFVEDVGVSPLEYLASLRIKLAKLLLSTTNLPLTKISEQAGYNNYSVFFFAFYSKTFLSPTEYRFLQTNPPPNVKASTNPTINIFKSIDDCYSLNSMVVSELSPDKDSYFKNRPIKGHYTKELLFDGVKYSFFAYEFYDTPSAKEYFLESSSKLRFSPSQARDFKIISTHSEAELTVWKENMAFRLISKNPKHFNVFRHYLNSIFDSDVYNH